MKTSDAGIYALALHEGIVPGPYTDSVGVFTYGIGHTAAAGAPDPAKMARGMPSNLNKALADVFEVFRSDLPKYEAGVRRAVKVPVTQAQFDAMVSFHYNTGAINKASFVKKLNAGDVAGAAAGFMAWKKPPEIIERRKAEQALFAKGVYPEGRVTVWGVNNSGRVVWTPVRRLGKTEVMALLRDADLLPDSIIGIGQARAKEIKSRQERPNIRPTHLPPKPKPNGAIAAAIASAVVAVGAGLVAGWDWLLELFN
ncbi:MAG: lysozyme [Beijerinckiaceae bacterium]